MNNDTDAESTFKKVYEIVSNREKRSLILWNALAVGLAVGTGYLAYKFASGPELYPEDFPELVEAEKEEKVREALRQKMVKQQQAMMMGGNPTSLSSDDLVEQQNQSATEKYDDEINIATQLKDKTAVYQGVGGEGLGLGNLMMGTVAGGAASLGANPPIADWIERVFGAINEVRDDVEVLKGRANDKEEYKHFHRGGGGDSEAEEDRSEMIAEGGAIDLPKRIYQSNKITDYFEVEPVKVIKPPPLETYIQQLKDKIDNLVLIDDTPTVDMNRNAADTGTIDMDMDMDKNKDKNKVDSYLAAARSALLLYISKIVEQPSVPRYRRISMTNQTYKKMIAPLQGHQELLLDLGFQRKGTYFEWTGPSGDRGINERKDNRGDRKKVSEVEDGEPLYYLYEEEDRMTLLRDCCDYLKQLKGGTSGAKKSNTTDNDEGAARTAARTAVTATALPN